uniref:Uncharacterized protein n=1 Tax=Arundo donax TaxID=35708 RepID=A0A0A8ZES0_ARUDO
MAVVNLVDAASSPNIRPPSCSIGSSRP